jgi:hypothetical protein
MTNSARGKSKPDAIRESLLRAPRGESFTAEERARADAARQPGARSVSQDDLLQELAERIRRGG